MSRIALRYHSIPAWLLTVCFLLMSTRCGRAGGVVMFSEYVEGAGNNKAVELYNAGDAVLDLTNVTVELYSNGSASNSATIVLGGQLSPGLCYVIANVGGDPALTSLANRLTGSLNFNGDDAVVLKKDGQVVDSIGQVGFDPGNLWGSSNGVSTLDHTLRRNATVLTGDTNVADVFDPTVEWTAYPIGTYDGLGTHQLTGVQSDSDSDGLPDSWEAAEFGSLAVADGGLDSDGDGMCNREEYLAGTCPVDVTSVFRLRTMDMSQSGCTLGWSGGTSVCQLLEYAASPQAFQAGQWVVVFSNMSSTVDGQVSLTNVAPGSGFFRLRAIR